MRVRYFTLVSITLCLAPTLWGQQSLNMLSLKRDTQVFERVIDERLRQAFSSPFALTSDPHAAYLQGYGIVVSFQLNINRATIRTPFGEVEAPQVYRGTGATPTSAQPGERRDEQVKQVKQILFECLEDYSRAIKQLSAHDRISITAHIDDRNELDPDRKRIVLVVSASRDDIDLFVLDKISREKFRERVLVLEY